MRWVQRGGSVSASNQDVQLFQHTTPEGVLIAIQEAIDRFAVRIVNMAAWSESGAIGRHFALVIFEEEEL